jgi:DNA-binding transcriptional LysR family regulator
MDSNLIRLFLDAAHLGSFSAAGRKHGLSPAAASASIQRLEASLQVKLFERTTRQLRLSEQGHLYRHFAEQAMALMQEAEASLHAGSENVRGMVHISAPSDLGRNVLMPMLDEFRARHPGLQYALTLSASTSNMVQDDLDLAICYGQLADSDMVTRVLAPSRRVVCAAPSLIAQTGGPAKPEDLANLQTLVLVNALGPVQDWRYCSNDDADERRSVRVRRSQQSNDGEIIRKWAIAGQGYAYKSILDISDDLRCGRLATVLDEYFTDSSPLHLAYDPNRYQPPRIKLLIEFLIARFAELA